MKRKSFIICSATFFMLLGLLFAQSSTKDITLVWDAPTDGQVPHGTIIYSVDRYTTNHTEFTKILTVVGTNTSCIISNLPYGVYSMYCTAFATNSQSTNVQESIPSNFVFFSHSPSVISD